MPAAHPPAVAWRVVVKVIVDGLPYEQISRELKPMAIGTISKIMKRFQATGSVETHQGFNPVGPPNTIMTPDRVSRLLNAMPANEAAGNGDEMLSEIYEDFMQREGVVLDMSTLCRAINAHGFSRPAPSWSTTPTRPCPAPTRKPRSIEHLARRQHLARCARRAASRLELETTTSRRVVAS